MVQAQPNHTKCKVRILEKELSKDAAHKILLKIEILPSEIQEDTRFIKPGETMPGFTFDKTELQIGDVVTAEAEYIGGPRGGNVLLKNLQKVSATPE